MGAMKSAVKRKTHKERSQPHARQRFGLLEKKKDYRLRAQDYHRKEQTVQTLRKKAEEKNPDEFYFGMQNVQTREGVHVKESTVANKYSQAELRSMKRQDAGYISLKLQTEAKRVEKLQQRLHLVGATSTSQHVVFVEDGPSLRGFSASEHLDTPEELLRRSFNRPRTGQLGSDSLNLPDPGSVEEGRLAKYKTAAYKDLASRAEKSQNLHSLAAQLALKRQLMVDGAVTKTKSKEPRGQPIYKWRRERKK